MPELPEVETLRRDLAARIVGRTITDFELLPGAERLLRGVPPQALRDRLCGAPITEIGRHGKYLLIGLGDGPLLVVHLRMTGSLRHRPAAAPPDNFLRARLPLDDGSELRFVDVRKFGTLDLVDDPAEALAKLGPDAIDPAFDSDALWSGLRGRRAPVKSMLLDQRFVAGIGNIYADEALFLARLHPQAPAGALRPAERRACTPRSAVSSGTASPTVAHPFATTPTPTARRAASNTSCASSAAPTSPATTVARPSAAASSAGARRTGVRAASRRRRCAAASGPPDGPRPPARRASPPAHAGPAPLLASTAGQWRRPIGAPPDHAPTCDPPRRRPGILGRAPAGLHRDLRGVRRRLRSRRARSPRRALRRLLHRIRARRRDAVPGELRRLRRQGAPHRRRGALARARHRRPLRPQSHGHAHRPGVPGRGRGVDRPLPGAARSRREPGRADASCSSASTPAR